MTHQIIYSSESATPMQMEDLEEILEHARRSNAQKGVTGALVYVDGVFLQILEGEAETVQSLMATIGRDVRHETVTVLKQGEIPAPVFKDWKMAYVSATAEQVAQWVGLSGTTAVPDILDDLRSDPMKVTQVAESILSLLVPESDRLPNSPA
jgi:hypothetical protein